MNAQHLTSFDWTAYEPLDAGLFMCCLATCCTAAPLEKLAIRFSDGQQLPTLAFLASVRSTLKELNVFRYGGGPLTIDAPLQRCTALTSLLFGCSDLTFDGCHLPTSLTLMTLRHLRQGLPSQAR